MYKYSRFCLMRQLSVLGLESVFLPDEDYGYTSRLPGTSGNDSLAADTVIALAVCAKAGMRTRGIGAYTDAVGRRRNISYPAETVFLSRNNLILPARTRIWAGPLMRQATRFPTPSTLISSPSAVIALLLMRK